MMALKISQASKQVHDEWWEWSVWLEGSESELADVEAVEWVLHPTFPDPIQRVTNRKRKFRLDSSGWGEFAINATVHRTKGATRRLRHWLRLESTLDQPAKVPKRGKSAPESAPTPEPSGTARVFVSSSVADAQFAHAIADHLSKQGVEVFTAEDVAPGSRSLRQADLLKNTAGTVVVTTGPLTRGMTREISAMRDGQVPLIPVLIGPGAVLPADFGKFATVRIKGTSPGELNLAAASISSRVKKLLA